MTFQTIMTVIAMHWVADFVLQTDWQAKNKSKDNFALLFHVITYTICIFLCGIFFLTNELTAQNIKIWELWALANGVVHFAVDYVTSRINTYLWNKGRVHDFFVMVGFDQLIHYACLFGSLAYLGVA
jgi:undecaprenyl pyrophosphate phosphatase UppP